MKKLFLLSFMCLMALSMIVLPACTREEGEVSGNYIDLGLTSGTKWKAVNEKNTADAELDLYTYDEAIAAFGNNLPSYDQWMELVNECSWTWTGMGYKVVGSNGKSIVLPASGYRHFDGSVYDVGSRGYYWSSPLNDSDDARYFSFICGGVNVSNTYRGNGLSVRLVQDK